MYSAGGSMNACTIIIAGATGDLATKRLIPAIYRLYTLGLLQQFVLVGIAREDTTIERVLGQAQRYVSSYDRQMWQQFCAFAFYVRVDITCAADFMPLTILVEDLEQRHQLPGNRLLYCSVASDFFCAVTHNSVQAGLLERRSQYPWHRIAYEKPFGSDAAHAQAINTCLASCLNETQIYRVDHYLTKEVVNNIALTRFSNIVFEPLWNNRYIDHVQIVLAEQETVGNRGAYYDAYGACKDVMQNHMLELLALVAMEPPETLTDEHIRKQRAAVLERVHVTDALLGQYHGYLQEAHVKNQSTTETFVAAACIIDNDRWAGVPFFLKTGKGLLKKETAVNIHFKSVDCPLTKQMHCDANCLMIKVAPEPSLDLRLNVKKPGTSEHVVAVTMTFCHKCLLEDAPVESYELMFKEIISGRQSASVGLDEIESAWRIADSIKAGSWPLYTYEQGSTGPKEMVDFEKKYHIAWCL